MNLWEGMDSEDAGTNPLARVAARRKQASHRRQGLWYAKNWMIDAGSDTAYWAVYAFDWQDSNPLEEGFEKGPHALRDAQVAVAEALERNLLPGDPYEIDGAGPQQTTAAHRTSRLRTAADEKPTEGVTRCECGSKYWDGDKCHDCGEKYRKESRRRVAYQSRGIWHGADTWVIDWQGEYGDGTSWAVYADWLMDDEPLEEGLIDGPQSIVRAQDAVAEALARHGLPGNPYDLDKANSLQEMIGSRSARRKRAEVYSGPMVKVMDEELGLRVLVRVGPTENAEDFVISHDDLATTGNAALYDIEQELIARGWRVDTKTWHHDRSGGQWAWANVEQVLPGITGARR